MHNAVFTWVLQQLIHADCSAGDGWGATRCRVRQPLHYQIARADLRGGRTNVRLVYVIGAGFSAGLGYPLTSDLLMKLWDQVDEDTWKHDLEDAIKFHNPTFDPNRFYSYPNIEELLSQLMISDELFHAGNQYMGSHGQSNPEAIRRELLMEIKDWFLKIHQNGRGKTWVREFCDHIRSERAAIVSFNWDLILDEVLAADGLSSELYGLSQHVMSESPVLLKPHGSLNWYEEKPGANIKEKLRIKIFESNNAGQDVYAFKRFRAPRTKQPRRYMPLIVPPVYMKDFSKPIFRRLWRHCMETLRRADKVVFLGYSMPEADRHAQFMLRCAFANRQKEGVTAGGVLRTQPTERVQVVIVNPDRAAAERTASVVGPGHECRWICDSIPRMEKWDSL